MANGNLTERQKIQERLREATEKAAAAEAAYNEKLAGKLKETTEKVTKKEDQILKAKENLAKFEEQLLDLQVLEAQYTKEIEEIDKTYNNDTEAQSGDLFEQN